MLFAVQTLFYIKMYNFVLGSTNFVLGSTNFVLGSTNFVLGRTNFVLGRTKLLFDVGTFEINQLENKMKGVPKLFRTQFKTSRK